MLGIDPVADMSCIRDDVFSITNSQVNVSNSLVFAHARHLELVLRYMALVRVCRIGFGQDQLKVAVD